MASMNTRAVMEHLGLMTSALENPEVSAMAEICEILRKLPDDDARLRVMRWSFGRFNPEFKRPLADVNPPAPEAKPDPLAATDIRSEIAAVAPEIAAAQPPRRREIPDFGRQLSELGDLFPAERPRHDATRPPANLDAF